MEQTIKYIIKSKPRAIKKIAEYIIGTTIILLMIGDFLYTPLKSLPLELQVFVIGELIPKIFLEFHAFLILLTCIGLSLYLFRWRSGNVFLMEDQINIQGQIAVSILIAKIDEITFFDSDSLIGLKRIVQIKTIDNQFKIKFSADDIFADFTEKLILVAGQYESIKIKSSVLYRQEEQG